MKKKQHTVTNTNVISNEGCRGRRLKIEVQKSDSLLQDDKSLIQKGKVIGAGPETICRIGDVIIFNAWGVDQIENNGIKEFYILDTDEFVLEVVDK